MKVHLVSDLHVDCAKGVKLNLPGGELLLVAGDSFEARNIDVYQQLPNTELTASEVLLHRTERLNRAQMIKQLSYEFNRYDRVIMIPGNHEFYNTPFEDVLDIMTKAFPLVEILYCGWTNLNNKTVLYGGTMWTDFDRNNPLLELNANRYMNDFAGVIKWKDGRHFSVEDALKEFKLFHLNLRRCILENPGKNIIVMSHHCPSFKGTHPRFDGNMCNGYFSANCEDVILDNPEIKMWLHGHTHNATDYMIGDCRVLCNPRGYYPYERSVGYTVCEFEI